MVRSQVDEAKLVDVAQILIGMVVIVVGIIAACIYDGQLRQMRQTNELTQKALETDQRAWISVSIANVSISPGDSIPVSFELVNTGKTPAKDIEGDVVVTVIDRGQHFVPGDFRHRHHQIHAGVIFPNAPLPFNLPVVDYGTDSPEPIVPDEALRHDIETGARTLVFYGNIRYDDALGTSHWTHFCSGINNDIAPSFDIEACVKYNALDNNGDQK